MTRDRHLPLPARSSFACVRASQSLVLVPLAMSQRLPLAFGEDEELVRGVPPSFEDWQSN
jgi:hypothetical protein